MILNSDCAFSSLVYIYEFGEKLGIKTQRRLMLFSVSAVFFRLNFSPAVSFPVCCKCLQNSVVVTEMEKALAVSARRQHRNALSIAV